ncbi:AmmeMemoRadiSam system protein A [Schaalia sp. 19OD2882]|uniref:AmmeMemoRadiSam system protein A n=1 Tax=Schaalia sp. 19OD2882 TaxID=2794089 RepID=UPI001C1EFF17|nr:AmmeMemoRadiSam system protein A [Schaalia sp. 19OD2882]QWW19028.1 AmmeMemoRadiSam system protein A [Schaalia sp. 19OD2882]
MNATTHTPLAHGAGQELLRIVRCALEEEIAPGAPPSSEGKGSGRDGSVEPRLQVAPDVEAALDAPGACFVTLTLDGHLRGCVGTLQAHRSLRQDAAANAVAAGTLDPRFPRLTPGELGRIRIEVSVLTAPKPLDVSCRDDALGALRPGIDGVVWIDGTHRATFLPQVWQQLPDPHDFLAHLTRKAGMPSHHWGPHTHLQTYQVHSFTETEK